MKSLLIFPINRREKSPLGLHQGCENPKKRNLGKWRIPRFLHTLLRRKEQGNRVKIELIMIRSESTTIRKIANPLCVDSAMTYTKENCEVAVEIPVCVDSVVGTCYS